MNQLNTQVTVGAASRQPHRFCAHEAQGVLCACDGTRRVLAPGTGRCERQVDAYRRQGAALLRAIGALIGAMHVTERAVVIGRFANRPSKRAPAYVAILPHLYVYSYVYSTYRPATFGRWLRRFCAVHRPPQKRFLVFTAASGNRPLGSRECHA